MSKLDDYKARLKAHRMSELGMSSEQYDAYIEAEHQRVQEINRCKYDRDHQLQALARWAKGHRRSFIYFTETSEVSL